MLMQIFGIFERLYLHMNILFLRVKSWPAYRVLGHPELIQICIDTFRFITFRDRSPIISS